MPSRIITKQRQIEMDNNLSLTQQAQNILIVDDDEFDAQITKEVLQDLYTVSITTCGQKALEIIASSDIDLILLDIMMPNITGYEVCRRLRTNQDYSNIPIIFLSGVNTEDERLLGYEVGGDDFLAKPAVAAEIRFKVANNLNISAERKRLKADLKQSFDTAMISLTTASEIGIVLHFLRNTFACKDYNTLCEEIIQTLANYGLEGGVQIRGFHGKVSLGSNGFSSALEESVLDNMFGHGRLFEFSSCLSCSYEHITVVVKNLDRENTEKRGRMRDNIALLVEGANERVVGLDREYELAQKHQVLTSLIDITIGALRSIEVQHHNQRLENERLMADLQNTFNMRLISLGLTEEQEEELALMLSIAAQRASAIYDQGLSTELYMEKVIQQFESFVN